MLFFTDSNVIVIFILTGFLPRNVIVLVLVVKIFNLYWVHTCFNLCRVSYTLSSVSSLANESTVMINTSKLTLLPILTSFASNKPRSGSSHCRTINSERMVGNVYWPQLKKCDNSSVLWKSHQTSYFIHWKCKTQIF